MLAMYFSFFTIQAISSLLAPYLPIILYNNGFSPTTIGFLLGLYECSGIVGPFVIAVWSDRSENPRLVLLVCTFFLMIIFIPIALATWYPLLVFALGIAAFLWRPMFPIQDAMVMHLLGGNTWKYTKIRATGTLGFVFFSLFFQFTPFLNTKDNTSLLVWLLIGGSLFFLSLLFVPKTVVKKKPQMIRLGLLFSKHALKQQLFSRVLIIGIVIISLNRFAMSAISNFLPLYITDYLGHGDFVSLLMAIGATSEFIFMLLAGLLLKRGVGPMQLISISSLGLCFRLGTYVLFPSLAGAIVGQLFHSIVFGFLHPAAVVFVYREMALEHRSTGMALYASIGIGVPTVLGTVLGGYVVDSFGFHGLFGSYILFALSSLLVFIVFRKDLEHPKSI